MVISDLEMNTSPPEESGFRSKTRILDTSVMPPISAEEDEKKDEVIVSIERYLEFVEPMDFIGETNGVLAFQSKTHHAEFYRDVNAIQRGERRAAETFSDEYCHIPFIRSIPPEGKSTENIFGFVYETPSCNLAQFLNDYFVMIGVPWTKEKLGIIIAHDLAQSFSHVQHWGYVHGDIKAQNVFLFHGGTGPKYWGKAKLGNFHRMINPDRMREYMLGQLSEERPVNAEQEHALRTRTTKKDNYAVADILYTVLEEEPYEEGDNGNYIREISPELADLLIGVLQGKDVPFKRIRSEINTAYKRIGLESEPENRPGLFKKISVDKPGLLGKHLFRYMGGQPPNTPVPLSKE